MSSIGAIAGQGAAQAEPVRMPSLGEPLTYADCLELSGALKLNPAAYSALPDVRIAVLRNYTAEPLLPVLEAEALRAGLRPELYLGEFDAVAADALNPGSPLYAFAPHFVLLSLWPEALSPTFTRRFISLGAEGAKQEAENIVQDTMRLVSALRQNSNAVVLVNNHPLPPAPTLGVLDGQAANSQTGAVLALNEALADAVRALRDVYIVDFQRVFARIGWDSAVDERMWQTARAPLAQPALLAYGREIGAFVRALNGKARKCLVFDCDNTLWGGIVGEDGPTGIKLGETYPGSAYQALQREALNFNDRGVLLAICSKNNHEDVIEILRDHEGMLLREDRFAVIKANWDDKVENLRAIAQELNIGLDSLVFIDDNGFEIENVRARLPEVVALNLKGKPSTYAAQLADCGLFDTLAFSEEDRGRAGMYAADRKRREIQDSTGSFEEYLATLGVEVDIDVVRDADVARVSQLTQKTNQFNLTTQRRSEADIAAMVGAGDVVLLRVKARDRIAELGLIGVAALRIEAGEGEITDFLMSCRALGRGIETALLARLVADGRSGGASRIVGVYKKTAKNTLCADFYRQASFACYDADAGRWALSAGDAAPATPTWIKLAGTANVG